MVCSALFFLSSGSVRHYTDDILHDGGNRTLHRREVDMSAEYYTVYVHIVPNGKVYVGQTAKVCLLDRWGFNGEGYKNNKPFYDDIQLYGWDNIAHVVICDMLTSEQADYLERYLIKRYKATWRDCGYNRHPGGKF